MGEAKPSWPQRRTRCAIYTRTSTDEGLAQDFNSLDAQRQACRAYIDSQRHEGWEAVGESYDDGGYSGGTLVRPALARLLAEVDDGQVDVIVVYKVDRLTRSLADFAVLAGRLEAAGASFVSVTQAFNTTTSLGCLTLNMLLSFAQFERELTGERIRDKIAASKMQGIFMGGTVPLGYDVVDRKLVAIADDAALVRHIYRRYLALGSVPRLVAELGANGYLTKRHAPADGRARGGIPFSAGMLRHILRNQTYLGRTKHKDMTYPGEHTPIVSTDLFDAVQRRLDRNAARRRNGAGAAHPSLLAGLVRDGLDRPMMSTHAGKGSRRYRYYVSQQGSAGPGARKPWRVRAIELETTVVELLTGFFEDACRPRAELATNDPPPERLATALAAAREVTNRLHARRHAVRRELVSQVVTGIVIHEERVEVTIAPGRLLCTAGKAPSPPAPTAADASGEPLTVLVGAMTTVRRGQQMHYVVDAPAAPAAPRRDERLIDLVADAYAVRAVYMESSPRQTAPQLAASMGYSRSRFMQLLQLGWLSPRIMTAIIDGTQPPGLTREALLRLKHLPISWTEQEWLLGFSHPDNAVGGAVAPEKSSRLTDTTGWPDLTWNARGPVDG